MMDESRRMRVRREAMELEVDALYNFPNWTRAARRWQRLGEVDRALAAFQEALDHGDIRGLVASDHTAYVNHHRGRQAAMAAHQRLGELWTPKFAQYADFCLRIGDSKSAEDAITSGVTAGDFSCVLFRANHRLANGDTDAAIAALKPNLSLDLRLVIKLARIYEHSGEIALAADSYEQAMSSGNPAAIPPYALFCEHQGALDAALSLYKNVLQNPQSEGNTVVVASASMAAIYSRLGRLRAAESVLERVSRTEHRFAADNYLEFLNRHHPIVTHSSPNNSDPITPKDAITEEFEFLSDIESRDLNDPFENDPDRHYAHFLSKNNEPERAIEILQNLVGLGNFKAATTLALVYENQGDLTKASALLDQCVERGDPGALYDRAMFHVATGNVLSGAADFQRSAETTGFERAFDHMTSAAHWYGRGNDHASAIAAYERAQIMESINFRETPNNSVDYHEPTPVAFDYAEYLAETGHHVEADAVLAREADKNVRAFVPLARLRADLGQFHEAMAAYTQAQRYDPVEVNAEIADLTRSLEAPLPSRSPDTPDFSDGPGISF